MRWRRLLVPAAAALVAACATLSGASDFRVGDAEDADDGSVDSPSPAEDAAPEAAAEDAGPVCATPSRCLAPPSGWEGPLFVSFVEDLGRSACPQGFVQHWARHASGDASAPPAACTCTCGAIGGACTFAVQQHNDNGCRDLPKALPLTVGKCVETSYDAYRAQATAQPACPKDASTTLSPLGGDAAVVACVPLAPEGCAEGTCVPPTPDGLRVCVRAELGDTSPCPSGYEDAVDLGAGLEDSRGCSACTCTPSATCSYSYTLFDGNDCTDVKGTFTGTTCASFGGIDSVKLTALSIKGSCAPDGGAPIGTVALKPGETICCQPP